MNWRTLPVLKRLDQEPRDEFEVDTAGVCVDVVGEERRGQTGDTGLLSASDLVRLK